MRMPCKNPCPTCPFMKGSAKGYFGGNDPEEYAESIHRNTVVACHSRTKHDEETGMPTGEGSIHICTGHIVAQTKVCKSPLPGTDADHSHSLVRSRENFEELKNNALGFDFKQYHEL